MATTTLGMIGLGRMGANMAERLRRGGHTVVGFDQSPQRKRDVESLEELVKALPTPRLVWVTVPGWEPLEATDLVTDAREVLRSWQSGTVIRSWLLDLAVRALDADEHLEELKG